MLEAEIARALQPFTIHQRTGKSGNIHLIRDQLEKAMWDHVGIMRNAEGLQKGLDRISQINERMMDCGLGDDDRVFNLTWHDWLNTQSLVEISEVIANAALSRENSRGAHYREDFQDEGNLEDSYFTRTRQSLDNDGRCRLKVERKNVDFSIVKPGESLVEGM